MKKKQYLHYDNDKYTDFEETGTPKYYHDRIYPIDVHSPAQAICFFSHQGQEYQNLTDKIVHWMLANMYGGDGYFYFRNGHFLANKISYMWWSQAWAFHGLTSVLQASKQKGQDDWYIIQHYCVWLLNRFLRCVKTLKDENLD